MNNCVKQAKHLSKISGNEIEIFSVLPENRHQYAFPDQLSTGQATGTLRIAFS